MNRWIPLGLLLLLSLAAWTPVGCNRGPRDIPEGTLISVYYSSDTRGRLDGCGCKHEDGGIARRSTVILAAREEDPAVVYCDAGNFLSGSAAADSTRGAVMVEAYNHLKPAAVNLGERELAFGVDAFKAAKREAKFDFVSANLRYKGGALAVPYVFRNVKDARIAFVGLCGTKDVMRSDSALLPDGVSIEDPVAFARRAVAGLEGKAEVIVVLSTCGDAVDSLLAQSLPQIDVIIGGRSYRTNCDSPWVIGKTRIVRAEHDGCSLGRMNLVFGPQGKLRDYLGAQIALAARVSPDAKMLELVRRHVPDFEEAPRSPSP
jgi:2',3'-cyclic-nucleotide 2'-phosphodiesterase/3'-nucleotidase/5'-nucleotidase